MQAPEDIPVVEDRPRVELVEDLAEHEGVEQDAAGPGQRDKNNGGGGGWGMGMGDSGIRYICRGVLLTTGLATCDKKIFTLNVSHAGLSWHGLQL